MSSPETIDNLNRKKKRRIILYLYLVLILLILSVGSTFAWFSLTRTPRVSDMSLYVNAPKGMEIALSPDGEWGQNLTYLDIASETSPLRPVTWSEKNGQFYAAVYGIDGRKTDNWDPLTDDMNANRDDYEGYYCVGSFYARTDERVSVSLAPAVANVEGTGGSGTYLVGTPVWNATRILHDNGGKGAENAVRIGIRITRLGADQMPNPDNSVFYVYEPNADTHNDGSSGYVPTPSIDSDETLVPEDRLFWQTATVWEEVTPVEKGTLSYEFGVFTSPTDLFTMEAGETVMIQIYIWLEGQDIDCTNAIQDAQVSANLQFSATTIPSSGME